MIGAGLSACWKAEKSLLKTWGSGFEPDAGSISEEVLNA